jgi:hypothetical protein
MSVQSTLAPTHIAVLIVRAQAAAFLMQGLEERLDQ